MSCHVMSDRANVCCVLCAMPFDMFCEVVPLLCMPVVTCHILDHGPSIEDQLHHRLLAKFTLTWKKVGSHVPACHAHVMLLITSSHFSPFPCMQCSGLSVVVDGIYISISYVCVLSSVVYVYVPCVAVMR